MVNKELRNEFQISFFILKPHVHKHIFSCKQCKQMNKKNFFAEHRNKTSGQRVKTIYLLHHVLHIAIHSELQLVLKTGNVEMIQLSRKLATFHCGIQMS